jgi:hypothetical protein
MDVHKDSIAIAYVSQDHGAEVTYVVTVAIARELVGFMWAIAQQVPVIA